MLGKLQNEEIEAVLKGQLIGRIGCHADNTTYVVPISYAYDGDCVYCHTHEGMKVAMMRKNPKVCFQVDRMDNMANWQSVIAWGEFEELTDPGQRKEALQKLVDRVLPVMSSQTVRLSPNWPFPQDDQNDIKGIVFRIRLKEKTGRFETNMATAFFA